MENKDRIAIELLKYMIKDTFAQGFDAIPIHRLNEVLIVAEGTVIEPLSARELELIDITQKDQTTHE